MSYDVCVFWNVDVTLEKIEEVGKVLLESFSNNFLKANADKCHLILNTDEPFSIIIDNEVIKNSRHKKLLGTNLTNRLGFDTHVKVTYWARNWMLSREFKISHLTFFVTSIIIF